MSLLATNGERLVWREGTDVWGVQRTTGTSWDRVMFANLAENESTLILHCAPLSWWVV